MGFSWDHREISQFRTKELKESPWIQLSNKYIICPKSWGGWQFGCSTVPLGSTTASSLFQQVRSANAKLKWPSHWMWCSSADCCWLCLWEWETLLSLKSSNGLSESQLRKFHAVMPFKMFQCLEEETFPPDVDKTVSSFLNPLFERGSQW